MKIKTFICCIFLMVSNVYAANDNSIENDTSSTIGLNSSPNDVEQLLKTLRNENQALLPSTPLTPYFNYFKTYIHKLNDKTGLNLGMAYTPLYQHAVLSYERQNAGGGEFEIFGQYKLNKDQSKSPSIGFTIEDKHRYTFIPPHYLNTQFNSTIRTVSGYAPFKAAITQLWFQTSIIKNVLAIRVGKIDLTSIMNSYAFESRRFFFLSNVFSSHPAVAKPENGLGAIVGLKLSPHLYIAGGIADANGKDTTSGFNTIKYGQYFSSLEIGYRQNIIDPQSDNYHIFLWQVAARPQENLKSDNGVSIVLQKLVSLRFIPFIKADLNTGRVQKIKKLLTAGFGYHYPLNQPYGLLGLATGFAELSDRANGHQFIFETFYRVQLTPDSQLTPDIQIIKTIPIQAKAKWIPVASIRYRATI